MGGDDLEFDPDLGGVAPRGGESRRKHTWFEKGLLAFGFLLTGAISGIFVGQNFEGVDLGNGVYIPGWLIGAFLGLLGVSGAVNQIRQVGEPKQR